MMNFKGVLASTAMLTSLIGGTSTFAASYDSATHAETEGTIKFTMDEDGGNIVDPTDPTEPIDPGEPNPNKGKLKINYVSDFDFGSFKNNSSAIEAYAKADRVTVSSTGEEKSVVPFVSTEDNRGTERNGWVLTVTQEKSFEDQAGNKLEGAQISIENLNYSGDTSNAPTPTNGGALSVGQAKEIASATEASGAGSWSLSLGNLQEDGTTDGVKLTVPANTVKNDATYSTILTWELAGDPTAD